MPGRFVQRGELLAYVTDKGPVTVRVVVPQVNADKVRKGSRDVEVRPVERPASVIPAKVIREVPGATDQLPSMTLSLQGGGKIGLDPSSQGGDAKTLQKLFVLDLQLPDGVLMDKLGSRVYVRFEHQPEPMGVQWYAGFSRILMKAFNV
jgi:putative peptide zinc metalloprotease protein